MKSLRNWTAVAAIFLIAVSVWLLVVVIPSEIPPPRPGSEEVSPRFYPNMGAILLGLFSLLLLWQEWRKTRSEDTELAFTRWGTIQWKIFTLAAAIVGYGFLVSFLDFYIISALMLIGLYICLGERNWVKIIGICAGCLVVIYILFEKGLRVELPRFIIK